MLCHALQVATESDDDDRFLTDHRLVAGSTRAVLGLQPARQCHSGISRMNRRGFVFPVEAADGHTHLQMELSGFTSAHTHVHVRSLPSHSN